MQITYAPTFRGAQWVKTHENDLSKADPENQSLEFLSQLLPNFSVFDTDERR